MHKLFIDTANLEEIAEVLSRGVISGVTTNPSLMAKEPKSDYVVHMNKIGSMLKDRGSLPLSVEVFAEEPEEMYIQAVELVDNIQYDNVIFNMTLSYCI